jgi:hypothetical protein
MAFKMKGFSPFTKISLRCGLALMLLAGVLGALRLEDQVNMVVAKRKSNGI